jgi:hypothetical protein
MFFSTIFSKVSSQSNLSGRKVILMIGSDKAFKNLSLQTYFYSKISPFITLGIKDREQVLSLRDIVGILLNK